MELQLIATALLLVGVFLVAIKVLKTMFEVATVAAISGAFYTFMAVSFDFPLNLQTVLGFAGLGTGLYVAYSILLPLLGLGWDVLTVPVDVATWVSSKYKGFKKSRRLSKIESTLKDHDQKLKDEDSGKKTKEVVLDKVKEKKEESSSQD
ncbi:hypothetical protein [Candidatus Nanohalococcus occultus]|uniref:Uncharacterized protein n=1 Tax=Candidatus Nanohalococcus occultus TaxID=2978047 RepID=A0ABY8CG34_9ARCH|nr:hypothetical protein SVXNc_0411 [Candidatus Nanohaloarchaeota archaeon SVXNc]